VVFVVSDFVRTTLIPSAGPTLIPGSNLVRLVEPEIMEVFEAPAPLNHIFYEPAEEIIVPSPVVRSGPPAFNPWAPS
jgi:hypothetical protein